ncbi:MAG: pilus assembly protein PilM [Bryobacteraceae bacterium]
MTTDFRRWIAFGTGAGIEVGDQELHVAVVRVRPSETGVLGSATVPDYQTRPAAEWGSELSAFFKTIGAGHIAATVILPRRDVIVRNVQLPGVADGDMESAVRLQIDTLHPFAEEDVYFSWARIGSTTSVLVGMARCEVVDKYSTLFAEAGIKVASFTFSAAVLYAGIRILAQPPSSGFLTWIERNGETEVYGESESRPVFSSTFGLPPDRAAALAASELRLDPVAQALPVTELLPEPTIFPASHDPASPQAAANSLVYAAALAGACSWFGFDGNLLPQDQRRASSRVRLIPTFVFGTTALVLLILLAVQSSYADSRYLALLQQEVRRLDPQARKADIFDKGITATRARTQLLDDFRRRAKGDMDTLAEVTKLIPPPGWVAALDLDRQTLAIAGEVDQAAVLLKTLDSSPYLEKSEFTMPIGRGGVGDIFRIRAARQTNATVLPPTAQGAGK